MRYFAGFEFLVTSDFPPLLKLKRLSKLLYDSSELLTCMEAPMTESKFVSFFFLVMFLFFIALAIFSYHEHELIFEILSGFTALVCLAMVFSKPE